jgi:hypothetical protein
MKIRRHSRDAAYVQKDINGDDVITGNDGIRAA